LLHDVFFLKKHKKYHLLINWVFLSGDWVFLQRDVLSWSCSDVFTTLAYWLNLDQR